MKCVSLSDDIFADHFPGHPVMPGALILEALAQLAGVLLEATMRERGRHDLHALLTMVDRAKFRRDRASGRPARARGPRASASPRTAARRRRGRRVRRAAVVAEAQLSFAFAQVTNPTVLAKRREFLDVWLTGSAGEPVTVGAGGGASTSAASGPVTPLGVDLARDRRRSSPTGACAIRQIDHVRCDRLPVPRTPPRSRRHFADEDRRLPTRAQPRARPGRPRGLDVAPARIGVFIGAESGRGRWQTVLGLARAARAGRGVRSREVRSRGARVRGADRRVRDLALGGRRGARA